jgi:hypothetical protein
MRDVFNNDDGCKFDFDYLFLEQWEGVCSHKSYFRKPGIFGVALLSETCNGFKCEDPDGVILAERK